MKTIFFRLFFCSLSVFCLPQTTLRAEASTATPSYLLQDTFLFSDRQEPYTVNARRIEVHTDEASKTPDAAIYYSSTPHLPAISAAHALSPADTMQLQAVFSISQPHMALKNMKIAAIKELMEVFKSVKTSQQLGQITITAPTPENSWAIIMRYANEPLDQEQPTPLLQVIVLNEATAIPPYLLNLVKALLTRDKRTSSMGMIAGTLGTAALILAATDYAMDHKLVTVFHSGRRGSQEAPPAQAATSVTFSEDKLSQVEATAQAIFAVLPTVNKAFIRLEQGEMNNPDYRYTIQSRIDDYVAVDTACCNEFDVMSRGRALVLALRRLEESPWPPVFHRFLIIYPDHIEMLLKIFRMRKYTLRPYIKLLINTSTAGDPLHLETAFETCPYLLNQTLVLQGTTEENAQIVGAWYSQFLTQALQPIALLEHQELQEDTPEAP